MPAPTPGQHAPSGEPVSPAGPETRDPAARVPSSARVVVVLGGGSTLGRSYHAGVLLALRELVGFDARDAHTLIGTSSGSIVASLLGAGIGPEDLYRIETGRRPSAAAAALIDRAREALAATDAGGGIPLAVPAAPLVALRAVGRWRGVTPGAVMAGLLPRGTRSLAKLDRYVDALLQGRWPAAPRLALCAVDLARGRRVILGADSGVPVGPAVAASCSLPAIHRPIRLCGRDYIDGAVHSLNNADTAADLEPDLIVVSAPLSTSRRLAAGGLLGEYRNLVHAQARSEIAGLRTVAPVVTIEPTPALVRAMGPDLADGARRPDVARLSYETSRKLLRQTAVVEELDRVRASAAASAG